MNFLCFFPSKNQLIFRSIFHTFLDGFWGPKSVKMSTSCGRDAHFHKMAFSDSGMILEANLLWKGHQNTAQMASNIDLKKYAIFHRTKCRFWINNGPTIQAKWTSKSTKNGAETRMPPKTPPRGPKGANMELKWNQNGAKMEPKGNNK